MPEDGQLLEAYASRGDVEALSTLIGRHARWLTVYLRGLLPSATDADDAFQDVWVKVIRFCGSYRGGSARAYLARIARSTVVDRFRRAGRPTVSVDAEDASGASVAETLVDASPTPGERVERRATSEDVREAVRALPEAQREVLLMRIEGELAFKEIAEIQGVPLGTVLTRMQMATKRLKKIAGRLK